ncbi:MAG: hypothetical protein QOJ98_2628 [Acidobacteriota bacterium]|nr:hypothetical protein [Acidobacteriota bacterium]
MPVQLSDTLSQFIRERLPSLEQIEIVLLLRRDPARAWTAPEVAGNLNTPPESTAMRLFLLASNGVIVFDTSSGLPRYRYIPSMPEEVMVELDRVYDQDRDTLVAVTGGTVTPDPLRSFADAFKLKK